MDEIRFTRLEEKIDKVVESVANIDKTLAVNTSSLQEHIRRTELLEDAVEPIKKHVAAVDGVLKFIGVAGVILGIIAGVRALL